MAAPAAEETHKAWARMVPFLFDWFVSHSLTWPSLACRWGPVVEEGPKANRQRLYLSEQTDGSDPNALVVVEVEVARPRTAAAGELLSFAEHRKSPAVSKPLKTIVHPGEVNRLRELPQHQNVVVTHTDAPELFVWNLETQPDRGAGGGGGGGKGSQGSSKPASTADLVLAGHQEDAEFALGVSNAAPLVASGGKDAQVLVWDLASHATSLAVPKEGRTTKPRAGARLQPVQRLKGHSATIEDVCWCPGSASELASVGDDYSLLLWDTRKGGAPVLHVATAHGRQDVHCVSWCPQQQDLLVTGAADGTLKVWDRRRASSSTTPAFSFRHHTQAVTVVEWSPHRKGAFASAGEDRLLCVWDLDARIPEAEAPVAPAAKKQKAAIPPQMMFQHAGHRAPVVDFQWNPADPWTLLSVADEAGEGGGGTLQLWRISDLIYRPDEEVVAELEQYRDYILTGQESALSRKPSTTAAGTAGNGTASGGGGSVAPEGARSAPSGTPALSHGDMETDGAVGATTARS